LLTEEEWRAADPIAKSTGRKGPGKKGGWSKPAAIDIWGMKDEPEEE
jgi:hypothetical protein